MSALSPPDRDAPGPEVDWYANERPLFRQMIADLQRIKNRARARWPWVVFGALVLAAGLVFMIARKVPLHQGRVVLSISESTMSRRQAPLPMGQLREYVTAVLMPPDQLLAMVERFELAPLRRKLGDQYALSELWDLVEIEVFRNYFLFEYDLDAPRSARIQVTVTSPDAPLAGELAHALAALIIDTAIAERRRAAEVLRAESERGLALVQARMREADADSARLGAALEAATAAGDVGRAAALRMEFAAARDLVHDLREQVSSTVTTISEDELAVAVADSGMGLDIQIAEERRPIAHEARWYRLAALGTVGFVAGLVLVSILIGAFDPRVHDAEDVTRFGIPVLGHVPGFPGDHVGSLRARGINARRVPWSNRWR